MTQEQRKAHIRMLETLPKRYHQCRGPELQARRNAEWHKPRGRFDTAFTVEFLTEKKQWIDKLKAQGLNQAQIAELWKTSPSSITRYLKLYEQRCK